MDMLLTERGDSQATRHKRLWVSVLLSAVEDQDLRWLRTKDAQTVCCLAGYEPEYAPRIAERIERNPPPPKPKRKRNPPIRDIPVNPRLLALLESLQSEPLTRSQVRKILRAERFTLSDGRALAAERHVIRLFNQSGLRPFVNWYNSLDP